MALLRSLSAYTVCENNRSQMLEVERRYRKSPYKRVFVSKPRFCHFSARFSKHLSPTLASPISFELSSNASGTRRSPRFRARAFPSCILKKANSKTGDCKNQELSYDLILRSCSTTMASGRRHALVFGSFSSIASKRPRLSANFFVLSCSFLVIESKSVIESSRYMTRQLSAGFRNR